MKPTDEEADSVRLLAIRLKWDIRELAGILEYQGQSKQPNLDTICFWCELVTEQMASQLSRYDRKAGPSELTATRFRLRINNKKLARHNDELAGIVQRQQAELDKREAVIACMHHIVNRLIALCEARGVAIPPELMGEPL